ncbi:MAG: acyl-CoA mutase large subunit family protein [Chitinophagaceae bacterium]
MDEKKIFTDSGIEIKPLYCTCKPMEELPGKFPFTRGIHPTMYRDKMWTMRQYAGYSSAEESNRRYHYLLKQGVTGLSVAFDLPTQIGYDSDHPMAEGEVGKVGVSINSLDDMEMLFKGIDLEKISTSMTINATAFILLAFYIALAKKRGSDLTKISGTIQNDILKEYVARGTFIYPPQASMRLITDIFEFCSKEVPKWNTISVSGYHIREAGSTAVQELAFTLANGKSYLKAAQERGLDINVFAKRMSFFFNAHNHLFEEVAKFRAARKMWATLTKSLGATDPKAQMLRFHTQTGGSTLTAQQSQNNIIRVTIQSLAAVLGGTQSLHTNGFDEAISLPSQEAASLALRTQQIIAFEGGVTETVDPLGGSFFVENLTQKMEEEAWNYLKKIDARGGSVKAIEQGFLQDEITRSSYKYQKQIENSEKIIVGLNKFVEDSEKVPEIESFTKGDDLISRIQIERLSTFRAKRDQNKVAMLLDQLQELALTTQNLLPFVIEAVENNCTLGEIADSFRMVWGEYH